MDNLAIEATQPRAAWLRELRRFVLDTYLVFKNNGLSDEASVALTHELLTVAATAPDSFYSSFKERA